VGVKASRVVDNTLLRLFNSHTLPCYYIIIIITIIIIIIIIYIQHAQLLSNTTCSRVKYSQYGYIFGIRNQLDVT